VNNFSIVIWLKVVGKKKIILSVLDRSYFLMTESERLSDLKYQICYLDADNTASDYSESHTHHRQMDLLGLHVKGGEDEQQQNSKLGQEQEPATENREGFTKECQPTVEIEVIKIIIILY
jgi:hypothetical protein